jgi:hypothetical protein
MVDEMTAMVSTIAGTMTFDRQIRTGPPCPKGSSHFDLTNLRACRISHQTAILLTIEARDEIDVGPPENLAGVGNRLRRPLSER